MELKKNFKNKNELINYLEEFITENKKTKFDKIIKGTSNNFIEKNYNKF